MQPAWKFIYSYCVIPVLWVLLQAAGVFNEKVRRGIRGRKHLFAGIEEKTGRLGPGRRVWFHSSSMGEFEQAKPIIAELKEREPSLRVIVTFFSPSGYEHSQHSSLADLVCYLPFDSAGDARRFIDLIRPDVAVLVRYDIWPNHIWELGSRRVPILMASATLRRQTLRRLPLIRGFHRTLYDAMSEILTVSEADAEVFRSFNASVHIERVGDTRYDQVVARSLDARKRTAVPEEVLRGRKVLVAGSSWPEDDAVLVPALEHLQQEIPDLLVIHVPHEPTAVHLEELERRFSGKVSAIRFSAIGRFSGERVIIVDSIGLLLSLYACAHVAYIGGSFRLGIHNVLEAAVYGIPVVFGPRHWNSQEPLMLLDRGGAFVVRTSGELQRTVSHLLRSERARREAGEKGSGFVRSYAGATNQVVARIISHLHGGDQETSRRTIS